MVHHMVLVHLRDKGDEKGMVSVEVCKTSSRRRSLIYTWWSMFQRTFSSSMSSPVMAFHQEPPCATQLHF